MSDFISGIVTWLLSSDVMHDMLYSHPVEFVGWSVATFVIGGFVGWKIASRMAKASAAEQQRKHEDELREKQRKHAEKLKEKQRKHEEEMRKLEAKAESLKADLKAKETDTLRLSNLTERQQSVLHSVFDNPSVTHAVDGDVLQLYAHGLVKDADGYTLEGSGVEHRLVLTEKGALLLNARKEADNG